MLVSVTRVGCVTMNDIFVVHAEQPFSILADNIFWWNIAYFVWCRTPWWPLKFCHNVNHIGQLARFIQKSETHFSKECDIMNLRLECCSYVVYTVETDLTLKTGLKGVYLFLLYILTIPMFLSLGYMYWKYMYTVGQDEFTDTSQTIFAVSFATQYVNIKTNCL